MTFPDGTIKEGQFENNVYVGTNNRNSSKGRGDEL